MVLVWPNWFGLDHNDLVLTKMKWSRPKWIGQVQIVIFYHNGSHLGLSQVTWPIYFGCDHFILVVTKSLWSSPNQFGQAKTILDQPKLLWSHRRTRHKSAAASGCLRKAELSFFRSFSVASKTLKEIQESYDLYLTHKLVVGRLKGHFVSLNPQLHASHPSTYLSLKIIR